MVGDPYAKWLRLVVKHMNAVIGGLVAGIILAISSSKSPAVQVLRLGWLIAFAVVAINNGRRNLKEGPDAHCIWTQQEQVLRVEAGMETYQEPFIEHYFKIPQSVMGIIGAVLFASVLVRFLRSRR